jgi:hypothetical protein
MFNIVKMQDLLKNLPDDQLARLMQDPAGSVPPYLVVTEKERRNKMREEFSGKEPPKNTIAQEMFGTAAPEIPEGGPPPGGPPQGAPGGQDASAQGLMGLPDQTMAGGAMRAMISGQPQEMEGMTAMPPQGMAAGGAVQFGSPFSNAPQQGAMQSQGYAPIQQYNPTPYVPPKNDYSNFRHQFDGRPTPHTPNPRVHMSEADRYGLPAGMAAPTYGTPGLNRTITGKDGQRTRYSWENDAARDAYIRYMTPPAKATAPVAKAGGGPIRMAGGEDVPTVGGPETSAFEDWWNGPGASSPMSVRSVPPLQREAYINELLKKPRVSGANYAQNPKYEQEVRNFLQKEIERARAEAQIIENPNPIFGSLFTPRGEVEERARKRAEGLAMRDAIENPLPSGDAPIPVPPPLSGRDVPGAVEALSQYSPPQQALTPTPDDVGKGTNAPQLPQATERPRRRSPLSAPVSGPSDKAAGTGIASLPQGPKGMTYEDYMRQANELISGGRQDPEEARRNSINTALMQLGLGMATSKSASPLAAIAEGGIPALQGFTEAEAQRRKDDRALVGEKLATLGVGAQMSQAEAKAADERDFREKSLAIQEREVEARREETAANAAYRERDNELKRAQIDAQIWANKNPAKIIEWKARFGEERGVEIGSQYEALTELGNLYNDQYQEAARLAKDTQNADDIAAAKKIFDKLTTTADDIQALSRFGQPQQASTDPGPLPKAQKGTFVLNP